MAGEIKVIGPTGRVGDVHLLNSSGQRWNGSAYETFSAGNYLSYCISVTEDGATGVYRGSVPSTVPAGAIDVILFIRENDLVPANGDRAVGAQSIPDWAGAGTTAASTPLGSLTGSQMLAYIVAAGFKRDDMNDEVYSSLTDTIMEMEQAFRFDEREKETTTTDTVTVLGDYKISLESDFGNLVNVVLIDGDTTEPLNRISKAAYDLLYSTPASDIDTGYPEHFAVFAGQLYIGPPPDSISYQYRLAYSQRLTSTVDASTNPVPFSAQYRELLKDGAMRRLFQNLKQFDMADRFDQYFARGMERAMTRERRNRGGVGFVAYRDI